MGPELEQQRDAAGGALQAHGGWAAEGADSRSEGSVAPDDGCLFTATVAKSGVNHKPRATRRAAPAEAQ